MAAEAFKKMDYTYSVCAAGWFCFCCVCVSFSLAFHIYIYVCVWFQFARMHMNLFSENHNSSLSKLNNEKISNRLLCL